MICEQLFLPVLDDHFVVCRRVPPGVLCFWVGAFGGCWRCCRSFEPVVFSSLSSASCFAESRGGGAFVSRI